MRDHDYWKKYSTWKRLWDNNDGFWRRQGREIDLELRRRQRINEFMRQYAHPAYFSYHPKNYMLAEFKSAYQRIVSRRKYQYMIKHQQRYRAQRAMAAYRTLVRREMEEERRNKEERTRRFMLNRRIRPSAAYRNHYG